MSMTTGDREVGNIRTDAEVMLLAADANGPVITLPLNVDARPQILDSGKIRLSLSLQYDLVDASVERGIRPKTQIRESVSVILESGKPLVVTQSADPVSDRKVTVEVKATVLR